MSELKRLLSGDIYPLGAIIEFQSPPTNGKYLLTGTLVSRASYPELSIAFPHPKLSNAGDVNIMKLGSESTTEYMRVK
jgi:hypothetical protein